MEARLTEEAELVKSSGGVFEVEDRGTLIYSKKSKGRFPGDNEIFCIVESIEKGLSLSEAQEKAAADIASPISFLDWLAGFFKKEKTSQ